VHDFAAQAGILMHGMGDVHPARVKVELLEKLATLYPRGEREAAPPAVRGVLSSSGSDAVETALKTAMLATGRAGVIAFEGAYHGLSFGALDPTHRRDFKEPFAARLPGATWHARFGDLEDFDRVARTHGDAIGAVIVEPIQGRGGERVPPTGFLRGLRERCDARGWLLVVDEIYTGFGRTGTVFACDAEGVVPDLLCVGKGLASGMPLSACLGLARHFDAWPRSRGEALHTQTFLGHPTSCAAALASLAVSERWRLPARAAALGAEALARLQRGLAGVTSVVDVRGRGLMLGVECARPAIALAATTRLLERGYVALPSGDGGRVLSLTPPLVIAQDAFFAAIDAIVDELVRAAQSERGAP
jgi:4-aminobutyrate aminotransferase-like enzyme